MDEFDREREKRRRTKKERRAMTDYTRYVGYETKEGEHVIYDSNQKTGWISIDSDFVVDLNESDSDLTFLSNDSE